MTKRSKKAWGWLWLSAFIIVLDQITKWFASSYLVVGNAVPVLPFFNFSLNFNTGAAFGFLNSFQGWQTYFFALVSIIVVILLIIWLGRIKRTDYWLAAGISLVIGGAIGNCIDRVRLGHVIDFFDFYIGNWHFDTFNVADSAICVGAFFLILRMFRR